MASMSSKPTRLARRIRQKESLFHPVSRPCGQVRCLCLPTIREVPILCNPTGLKYQTLRRQEGSSPLVSRGCVKPSIAPDTLNTPSVVMFRIQARSEALEPDQAGCHPYRN